MSDKNRASNDLLAAATRLVNKLRIIHGDDGYNDVWHTYQSHKGPYVGPTYEREFEELAKAVKNETA